MTHPLHISWKTEILPLLMVVTSFAFGFYFYLYFPERVITHWDFAGNPDAYSGKFFGAFVFPLIILALYGLFFLLPFIDPKKERYLEFKKVYYIFKTVFLLFFEVIFLIAGFVNLGYSIPMHQVVPLLVGVLMIIIGNFMGKIKNNCFIGIRTPWTLSSENVWNKTHRLGGWLFLLYGILLMLTPFFGYAVAVTLVGVVLIVFGTLLYSYVLYKKEHLK